MIEDLLLNAASKTIKLLGGYESTFTTQTGCTTVQGQVLIEQGSLVVDRVVIK